MGGLVSSSNEAVAERVLVDASDALLWTIELRHA